MFWTLTIPALVCWAGAFYFDQTFGGFIHLIPAAAAAAFIFRGMVKQPNTEFGRWRPRKPYPGEKH